MNLQSKLDLFKKNFPSEKISSLKQMEGADNYILEINDLWICKVSKNLDPNNLEIEAKLLNALKNKFKIRIPIIEHYEPNFLVYKKIPGTELTTEIFNKFSLKQKEELAFDIAYFLYQLHNSLNLKQIAEIGLIRTDWPWSRQKLTKESIYLKDPVLIKIFNKLIKEYANLCESIDKITLIHNDMISRNIIINEQTGKLSGIIDFTDAALDDPYLDLRLNYMSIQELKTQIAKNYADLSNITLDIIKIYIYYLATEFSRYLECVKNNNFDELLKIKHRILESFEHL